MIEFMAACGHRATVRDLGRICEQCFAETHAELARERAVVEAAAALIESGDWDCFDDAANARFIALESAVKVWRGAQTDKGEQGNG